LAKVGVDSVIRLCRKFGITSRLVPNLPLALGASDLTLLEHTSAFTTFPNDGVHITPRTVYRVTNYDGRVIDDFQPEVTDVLPAADARIMVSMLREVFNSGTAVHARPLAQKYALAGKTGTTNEFSDAWFLGFTPSMTCGVYVGFDDHQTLGDKEEGARVALPIWEQFMSEYLKGQPVEEFPHSPLLTNPDQVKQILASAGSEILLERKPQDVAQSGARPASGSAASAAPPGAASSVHPGAVTPPPTAPAGGGSALPVKVKTKAVPEPAPAKAPSSSEGVKSEPSPGAGAAKRANPASP
jgi:penicillin-binding protein 1A